MSYTAQLIPHEDKEYYSSSDACILMGVHRDTVIAWIRKGKVTGVKDGQRHNSRWLVLASEVDTIRANRQNGCS